MAGIAVKDSLRLALCLAGAGLLPGMPSAASANALLLAVQSLAEELQ